MKAIIFVLFFNSQNICNKKDFRLYLNSQLFLIASLSDSQLFIYNPNIYSCSIPVTFWQALIHMPQLCARSSSSETPARHLATLQSAQGQNFLHFAKSDSFIDGMINHHHQTICYIILLLNSFGIG